MFQISLHLKHQILNKMKKNLLQLLCLALPLLGFSQIFQENWDGNGPGLSAWKLINADGLEPDESVSIFDDAWILVNTSPEGEPTNFAAASTSWYTPPGTANDWLISPVINLSGASPSLYWEMKAQDRENPDGYKVMLSTNGGNTMTDFDVELYSTYAENSFWTKRAINLTPYNGKNVRIAFVNNSNDKFVLLLDNIKVDYTYVEPPIQYCGPLVFQIPMNDTLENNDMPITYVNFAGIDNTTSAEAFVGNFHEYFLDKIANVSPGKSYDLTLKGNTYGEFTIQFIVFIDWNQNGTLDDDGEVYPVTQTIYNSTGTDDIKAVQSISVPADALPGNTRMRIKLFLDDDDIDPCVGSFSNHPGSAEDYTVNVGALGVNDVSKNGIKTYPNPVKDIFNIEAQGKIKTVKVFDMTGKHLLTKNVNEAKSQIDFSRLNPGIYIVSIETETGTQSIKVIKK